MGLRDGQALLLALGLSAVLAACGGGGGGGPSPVDDTLRPISDEELSRMVLSIEDVRPEYGAFIADEENGPLTLDKAVESFHDAAGRRAQLMERHWESAYFASYQVPAADAKPAGVSVVLSIIHLYEASSGAAATFETPTGTAREEQLEEIAPDDSSDIRYFSVDLGHEAGGFVYDQTFGPEVDPVRLSTARVQFRRGRLIGQILVTSYDLDDPASIEDIARDLAGKMNDRMAAVLAE